MADPQPITYTPITYTPQFQAPSWRDNVDLVSASAPNGVNAQFRSIKAEFDVLKGVVQQLNAAISTLTQALNDTTALTASTNTVVDAANAAADQATAATGKASTATDQANATATQATQQVSSLTPPASWVVAVNHQGDYTARCLVSYDDLIGQRQNLASGNLQKGGSWSAKVPGGAKNVNIHCEGDTGLAWTPVKTILDQRIADPVPQSGAKTITIWGTTLDPKSDA